MGPLPLRQHVTVLIVTFRYRDAHAQALTSPHPLAESDDRRSPLPFQVPVRPVDLSPRDDSSIPSRVPTVHVPRGTSQSTDSPPTTCRSWHNTLQRPGPYRRSTAQWRSPITQRSREREARRDRGSPSRWRSRSRQGSGGAGQYAGTGSGSRTTRRERRRASTPRKGSSNISPRSRRPCGPVRVHGGIGALHDRLGAAGRTARRTIREGRRSPGTERRAVRSRGSHGHRTRGRLRREPRGGVGIRLGGVRTRRGSAPWCVVCAAHSTRSHRHRGPCAAARPTSPDALNRCSLVLYTHALRSAA